MKWFSRAALLVFATAWFLSMPRLAAATDDPRLDYHTITTPHFWVHYHDGAEALAKKVAVACEEAHLLLVPLLDWVPKRRTHVVVEDKSDAANGFAASYGRRQITVLGMPPESDSVLGFYDDWIRVLVFHEYVHILHLDTTLGIPPLVNKVIGRQWFPNQTLPRWYVEGLATYYESATTRGGRVNASLFKMYLRVAALEGEFFDLGAISGSPYHWPGGTTAYLYGGFFLDYVFEKYGSALGSKFNRIYGRRILPWALNSIARDLSGETFDTLYEQWTAAESARAHAVRIAVRAAGETRLEPVTGSGGNSGFPKLRPGTSEVWFYDFGHRRAPHYSSVLSTGESYTREFEVEGGAGPFGFTPDGDFLLYSQRLTYESNYRYSDIFARDLETGSVRRLTDGERAREPAVSDDGELLAYVRNRGGTMELVTRPYPHVSGPATVVASGLDHDPDEPARWQQIATPDWSPDGRRIVFSWWRQDDGQRDLWIVDLDAPQGERLRRLTNDFAVDLDPNWADDGRIYFASDRTGVYNIYSVDPGTDEIQQVSNVAAGVFAPQLSPDGRSVFVSTYGPDGFDVAKFPVPESTVEAPPSKLDSLPKVEYPDVDTSTFAVSQYRPLRWMGPLLLQPQLGVVTSGAGAGASIVGFDPIRHHSYELTGGYTTGREVEDRGTQIAAQYGHGGLPIGLTISGSFRDVPRTRSFFAQSEYIPFLERQWVGRVSASYPFRALNDQLTFSTSYEVDYTEFQDVPAVDHDPADLEPVYPTQGFFNELDFGLRYSNRESYPQSITASKGWSAGISLDVQDRALGSDYQRLTFSYGFDTFIQNPVFPRHVLALALDGAISTSDTNTPRRFAVGGNRPQDILTSLVLQQQRNSFVIRGFPPSVSAGSQYQRGSAEYRFPVLTLDQGFSTVPIFLRQIKGAVFIESGGAFDGFLGDADYLTGFGGELLLQTIFGYYLFGNLRLGYAHGLGEDGIEEFYALFGGGF